jgi:short-subunit dehydrogenase
MIRAFLPPMLEMNHGSIVAVAAVCGHIGMPNMIPYAASKFGVRGMMESLYIELRYCRASSNTAYVFFCCQKPSSISYLIT